MERGGARYRWRGVGLTVERGGAHTVERGGLTRWRGVLGGT